MPSLEHSTNQSRNATHEPPGVSGMSRNSSGAIEHATDRDQRWPRWRSGGIDRHGQLRHPPTEHRPALDRLGDQIGAHGVDNTHLDERFHGTRSSGTSTMPSISGASRWLRAMPGSSTSTVAIRADEVVARGGR